MKDMVAIYERADDSSLPHFYVLKHEELIDQTTG